MIFFFQIADFLFFIFFGVENCYEFRGNNIKIFFEKLVRKIIIEYHFYTEF